MQVREEEENSSACALAFAAGGGTDAMARRGKDGSSGAEARYTSAVQHAACSNNGRTREGGEGSKVEQPSLPAHYQHFMALTP